MGKGNGQNLCQPKGEASKVHGVPREKGGRAAAPQAKHARRLEATVPPNPSCSVATPGLIPPPLGKGLVEQYPRDLRQNQAHRKGVSK